MSPAMVDFLTAADSYLDASSRQELQARYYAIVMGTASYAQQQWWKSLTDEQREILPFWYAFTLVGKE